MATDVVVVVVVVVVVGVVVVVVVSWTGEWAGCDGWQCWWW